MMLLGRSPQMRRIRSAVARLAPRDTPVLLVGESGVGAHEIAERLHSASGRKGGSVSRPASLSEALYARLSAAVLRLPPLRERREDIAVLARQFVKRCRRQLEFGPRALEPRTVELLTAYDWPGNVRELANVIERTFVLCPTENMWPEEVASMLRRSRRA
jgi:two-component system, NtrC family, response regulator